jgi:hypothetical protein
MNPSLNSFLLNLWQNILYFIGNLFMQRPHFNLQIITGFNKDKNHNAQLINYTGCILDSTR